MKIRKIAIVGYGQFGAFMAGHLEKHFIIVPIRRDTDPCILEECEAVIFSVPFSSLESVIKRLKKHIRKDTLILDVISVKQKPITLLKKHFKQHQILGTHPVFGPQSGKSGIKNLPIVLCNVSCTAPTYTQIKKFLRDTLQLNVIEETPKEHDHEMANVQALTHFIARALVNLDIKSYATNTQSYQRLLELRELLNHDSWELFKTIQNSNTEARGVRKKLINEFLNLEKKLERERI